MSGAWGARSGPAHRVPIEEIDLTLSSSPEPEPQARRSFKTEPARPAHRLPNAESRPLAHRQQHHSHSHETAPRHKRPATFKTEPARRPIKQVHPDHLSHILNTSDPQALRKVLLNLCNLSPALSGAIVRGLAHSSTYARPAINKYQSVPNIKTDTARARISSPVSKTPELLSSPKIPHYVKNERTPSPAPSNASSSSAFSRPLPMKPTKPVGSTFRSPLMEVSTQNKKVQGQSKPTARICVQCKDPFELEFGFCNWHPGQLKMTAQGDVRYSCCASSVSMPGCEESTKHIAAPKSPSLMKRPTPSRSAYPNQHMHTANGPPRANTTARPQLMKMICDHCQQLFDDGTRDNGCSFHPGRKRMNDHREVRWSCCGGGPREAGCQFEDFHEASHGTDAPHKRTLFNEPSSLSRATKNPRLF